MARESTRGTLLNPKLWVRHTAVEFAEQFENIASEAGLGRIEQMNQSHLTYRKSGGVIEGEVGATTYGLILYSLLGSLSTSIDTPVSGANTHAFSLAQTNQHPILAILKQDPDRSVMMSAMPTSSTITFEKGAIVKHKTEFVGLGMHDWSTQAVSYPTTDLKFLSRLLDFRLATNIAGLSAASPIDVKKLELTIEQNAMTDDHLGSIEPIDIVNQQFHIHGMVELERTDDVWRNYINNNTNRAMQIKVSSDAFITGTTNASLTFQFPNCMFTNWDPTEALDEIVTQSIEFYAMYDLANSQASVTTAQLINGETGSNY